MEIDNGYQGYIIYCGGTKYKYHEYEWLEWDKRTPRIAEKTNKKERTRNDGFNQ